MAEQTYYIGSVGPLFYDDAEVPDGFAGTSRYSLLDSAWSSGSSDSLQPGDEVVTDVILAIDFTAETFTLTLVKKPLGNPLVRNDGP